MRNHSDLLTWCNLTSEGTCLYGVDQTIFMIECLDSLIQSEFLHNTFPKNRPECVIHCLKVKAISSLDSLQMFIHFLKANQSVVLYCEYVKMYCTLIRSHSCESCVFYRKDDALTDCYHLAKRKRCSDICY